MSQKIQKIRLSNFRNFKSKIFSFSPKTTVIVGPNASGKTNILESLYLLSTGKSFRARVEEEMVNYDEEIARVKGIAKSADKVSLEVVLTRGEITVGENPKKVERVPRKKLLVDGVNKRLFNFVGNFKVVLFAPKDLDLVTESPSGRRDFLDTVLSQVDREYARASLSYSKGLRQRNKLLFRIREEGLSRSQLLFWNKLLIKNGDYMSSKREEFMEFINSTHDFNNEDYSVFYDKSAISEARLDQYAQEEVAAATTLVGPHRDDFVVKLKTQNSLRAGGSREPEAKLKSGRELARFGSRGEQRMGTLWLKLAELAYIEEETKVKPTLLLDDIFSELDHKHREFVMDIVRGQQTRLCQGFGGQAIITTADPHFVEDHKKVELIHL
jgi:DNA replication and repair protein RecF